MGKYCPAVIHKIKAVYILIQYILQYGQTILYFCQETSPNISSLLPLPVPACKQTSFVLFFYFSPNSITFYFAIYIINQFDSRGSVKLLMVFCINIYLIMVSTSCYYDSIFCFQGPSNSGQTEVAVVCIVSPYFTMVVYDWVVTC